MSGLIPLGDANAIACEGDACLLPGADPSTAHAVEASATDPVTPGR